MGKYYVAVLDHSDAKGIAVEFRHVAGCFTCGNNLKEALENAKESLSLHLKYSNKDEYKSVVVDYKCKDDEYLVEV